MATTPEGYAAAAFVLMVAIFVLRWTNRHQQDWLDDCEQERQELRQQMWVLNRRFDLLVAACRFQGVEIPKEVWSGPSDFTGSGSPDDLLPDQ